SLLPSSAQFICDSRQVQVDAADVVARDLVQAAACQPVVADLGQKRPDRRMCFGEAAKNLLFGAHLIGKERQAVGQGDEVLIGCLPVFLARLNGLLQGLKAIGGLLQQRLQICWDGGFPIPGRKGSTAYSRHTREPFFHLVHEAVVRLTGLQLQKAKHQRASETKERGGKGSAHAAQGPLQSTLQLSEEGRRIASGKREAADGFAHRIHRLDQPPEGSQQAQKDQQADQIAGDVVRLVYP